MISDVTIVSFPRYTNSSALCDAIRTPNTPVSNISGCPFGPGDIALGVSVPVNHAYGLTAITTRVRMLDSSVPASELACFAAYATPYYPGFWPYRVMLWAPIGIALGYAVVLAVARLWAAYTFSRADREAMLATSLTAKLSISDWREKYGPVVWSALAGSALQPSTALRRFATPGVMDVVWIVQWAAVVGMVAVRWPDFACACALLR